MNLKKIIFFVLAVSVSLLAGTYRWGDSAHSIGLIKAHGGEARHPSHLESGRERYMLIATATVIPPFRGDARVVLEGEPKVDYRLALSGPIVDLGIKELPELNGDIIYGLKPKDRIALWVEMRPPEVDPVCGMASGEGFIRHFHEGKEYAFCSQQCMDAFLKDPEKFRDNNGVKGKYTLAFYDTKTDSRVLSVPVIFEGKEGMKNAGGHHH